MSAPGAPDTMLAPGSKLVSSILLVIRARPNVAPVPPASLTAQSVMAMAWSLGCSSVGQFVVMSVSLMLPTVSPVSVVEPLLVIISLIATRLWN
jgi:hypothetical protein